MSFDHGVDHLSETEIKYANSLSELWSSCGLIYFCKLFDLNAIHDTKLRIISL